MRFTDIPKPPRPPFHGAFKVYSFDPREPMNYMQMMMFACAPHVEPFAVSARRLTAAMRADGQSELRPLTIWATYRKHPELSQPLTEESTH